MSYRVKERSIIKKSYELRNKYYAPILKWLAGKGVTANHITYFRAVLFVFGVMYPLYVKGAVITALLVYFFGFWLLDTFDGALARYTKTASDKGRFNDIYVDVIAYSLFVMGIAYVGFVNVFIMFYHVIIHGALYLISAIFHNENEKSDWLLKSEPNLTYIKLTAHLVIIVVVLAGINIMDFSFIILNIYMTLLAIYYFIKLQKQTYKR